MIYDSLDALASYASIIGPAVQIERLIAGEVASLPLAERIDESGEARPFDGTLRAHKERHCLHWVSQGRDVIAVGYREQTKGLPVCDEGTIVVEGAQVATVLTLREGEFVLFMPGEPYALRLAGSSGHVGGESIRFV